MKELQADPNQRGAKVLISSADRKVFIVKETEQHFGKGHQL